MKFSLLILMFEFFSFGSSVTLTISSQLTEGGTAVLKCGIGATLTIGTWKKGANSASDIATCTAGACTPSSVNARYAYTKTTNRMILTINPLERTSDQGSWTCAQSTDFATKDIGTIYTTSSVVTVTVSGRKLTCQTSCVYPADTSGGQFTWSYNNNNQDTTIAGDAITDPTSLTDGCSNSEAKIDSMLDIDKIEVGSEITVTFMCSFTQTGQSAFESTPTESLTLSPVSQAGISAVVIIISSIYGPLWILAIVVLLVIYRTDQKLLPWNLCVTDDCCDGLLKKCWIWILLFIVVPFVTFVVAICWFITKRPGKPTKPVISPNYTSVNVGDTATFTCTSDSTTYPAQSGLTMNYTWRRNGVDMKSERRYMVFGNKLTVTKVVKEDASDKFSCIAREGSGLTSDESDAARIVISKPTKPVIYPESVSVNVGDTATFTCTSRSTTHPAQSCLTMNYTWRRNGKDMKSERRYKVSGQTLTVTKVVKGDASDKFTCLAREDKGLTSDESDSARIVITKPTWWTKPGNYGKSDQSIPLLKRK